MVVEGVDPVGDINVVAVESGPRFDPSGAEVEIRISFKKRKGQHLTGAVSEEVPVGPMPPTHRVGLHSIFGKNIAATVNNDSLSR